MEASPTRFGSFVVNGVVAVPPDLLGGGWEVVRTRHPYKEFTRRLSDLEEELSDWTLREWSVRDEVVFSEELVPPDSE
jgi:hypothetical protein